MLAVRAKVGSFCTDSLFKLLLSTGCFMLFEEELIKLYLILATKHHIDAKLPVFLKRPGASEKPVIRRLSEPGQQKNSLQ